MLTAKHINETRKVMKKFRDTQNKLEIQPNYLICNPFVVYLKDNHPDLFKILIKRVGLKKKDFKIIKPSK